ncbi:MAG: 4-hydroxybenzoate octaprenyltransferase [Magnetococcales bacterium]|nr:4-hydroxybenzoate octaprenyltransferase [Magnetococcales bacterium]
MKPVSWIEKISHPIIRESLLLMRVDRPVGTWLLLWPGLWSLTGASSGLPDIKLMLIFIFGTFIMRSAGCVANDLADRNFDPHVERTRLRPLARKAISIRHAVLLLIFLLIIALLLGLQLNHSALLLCIPGAFLAVSYPLTKRFIDAPQLYLGMSFGWSVIIAWAAVKENVDWPAWTLFLATVFWATGYDTIYGMVDKKDDIKIGVRSTALLFGDHAWKAVGIFYFITAFFWFLSGYLLHYSLVFHTILLIAMLHLARQVILIRKLPESTLIPVFTSNTWTGGIVLLAMMIEKTIY